LLLRAGRPIEAFDALIAATALTAGAGLATRDIRRSQEPRNEQMAVTRLAGR
jgi:predicted nucleic acid-binding protein